MRKKLFDVLPNGLTVPRCIRCYMMKKNPTVDYITVVFTHAEVHSGNRYKGMVVYRGYSGEPFYPTGFAQWGEAEAHRFHAGGSRVAFSDLPKDTKRCVIQDYAALWGYRCSITETENGWFIKEFCYIGINKEEEYIHIAGGRDGSINKQKP